MLKKIIARLVTNFQPRMDLGKKRFNEDREAHEQASDYNKEIAMQHERERLRDQMEKREEPVDPSSIPSDSEA